MWFYVSIILLVWLLYDLIKGEVWSYYKISRSTEPKKYWFFMCIWTAVTVGSLILSYLSFSR